MPISEDLREVADRFLSAALKERQESGEFLSYFVISLSRRLDAMRDGPRSFNQKVNIAGYLLTALLRNFYQGSADEFYWQSGVLRKTVFHLAETLGLHILPVHFYSPVPAVNQLDGTLWSRRSELPGIQMNEQEQLKLLATFAAKFRSEYGLFPEQKPDGAPPYTYYLSNGNYGNIDGVFLYCIIRHFKPKRIYEIGSGFSTFLAGQAIRKNQEEDPSYACELVAIEPYPNQVLKAGFPGLSRLVTSRAQDVPLTEFQKLEQNDILFIDSSHVLKIGSDVQYEYLEILPRLNNGVLVHIHDIFLPMEYPQEWVLQMNRYWTEQYLLQAFLIFNHAFEVFLAANYLSVTCPEVLESSFGSLTRGQVRGSGSFWMRKTQ